MEAPRISRVGQSLIEHTRLAMCFAVVIPLGAIATKVLRSQHTAKEAAERKAIVESTMEPQDFGEAWRILSPEDFDNDLSV